MPWIDRGKAQYHSSCLSKTFVAPLYQRDYRFAGTYLENVNRRFRCIGSLSSMSNAIQSGNQDSISRAVKQMSIA